MVKDVTRMGGKINVEKSSETLNFRVSKKLLELLKRNARESDLSVSEYARVILREAAGLSKPPLKRAN